MSKTNIVNFLIIYEGSADVFEPKQRAHSPLLAAGNASKLKTDYIPYGEDSTLALRRGASKKPIIQGACGSTSSP